MKKIVLKVNFHDNRIKQKAMRTASGLSGIESVSLDTKDKKMTLSGDIDPVKAVSKLRKLCQIEIVSVGPLKEEKEEPTNVVPIPLAPFEANPFYYQMTLPGYSHYYYL